MDDKFAGANLDARSAPEGRGPGWPESTHWFDKNRRAIFGRRGQAASVRSEAEDERPSAAASNPTLSATFFRFFNT